MNQVIPQNKLLLYIVNRLNYLEKVMILDANLILITHSGFRVNKLKKESTWPLSKLLGLVSYSRNKIWSALYP